MFRFLEQLLCPHRSLVHKHSERSELAPILKYECLFCLKVFIISLAITEKDKGILGLEKDTRRKGFLIKNEEEAKLHKLSKARSAERGTKIHEARA
jgi:hypothetical protein